MIAFKRRDARLGRCLGAAAGQETNEPAAIIMASAFEHRDLEIARGR